MDLEESGDGDDLLADNTMDGLDAPPELPAGAVPTALPQVAETPQQAIPPALTPYSQPRSVFPGEPVCWSQAPLTSKAELCWHSDVLKSVTSGELIGTEQETQVVARPCKAHSG